MDIAQLEKLKLSYVQVWEKQSALKEQVISYLYEMGSVSLQHDDNGEVEGAPTLAELPTVFVDDYADEVMAFAIVGSTPMGTEKNPWIEFQLVALGEYVAETTIDEARLESLMDLLEAYRYYNNFLQVN